ncbi:MAG TPA: hypothetical protein VKO20_04835, partial [Desulfosalsimonadaceae bacterium]|nr:hypothetical protein [Desulfosalsimonadaceae bacterium]
GLAPPARCELALSGSDNSSLWLRFAKSYQQGTPMASWANTGYDQHKGHSRMFLTSTPRPPSGTEPASNFCGIGFFTNLCRFLQTSPALLPGVRMNSGYPCKQPFAVTGDIRMIMQRLVMISGVGGFRATFREFWEKAGKAAGVKNFLPV